MPNERTSKPVASKAGKLLKDIARVQAEMNRVLNAVKSIAASALTQAPNKRTPKRRRRLK